MVPKDFIDFSSRFEVGFLVWIDEDGPTMVQTRFIVSDTGVRIEPGEYDPLRLPKAGDRVTLIYANPLYTERCEMGIIQGALTREGGMMGVDPHDITWSISWDVQTYPERIVRRWRR